MPVIVGVTFERAGQLQYFDAGRLELEKGAAVVAQTQRGLELGTVVDPPKAVANNVAPSDLKPLVRRATERDLLRSQDLRSWERVIEINLLGVELNWIDFVLGATLLLAVMADTLAARQSTRKQDQS